MEVDLQVDWGTAAWMRYMYYTILLSFWTWWCHSRWPLPLTLATCISTIITTLLNEYAFLCIRLLILQYFKLDISIYSSLVVILINSPDCYTKLWLQFDVPDRERQKPLYVDLLHKSLQFRFLFFHTHSHSVEEVYYNSQHNKILYNLNVYG